MSMQMPFKQTFPGAGEITVASEAKWKLHSYKLDRTTNELEVQFSVWANDEASKDIPAVYKTDQRRNSDTGENEDYELKVEPQRPAPVLSQQSRKYIWKPSTTEGDLVKQVYEFVAQQDEFKDSKKI